MFTFWLEDDKIIIVANHKRNKMSNLLKKLLSKVYHFFFEDDEPSTKSPCKGVKAFSSKPLTPPPPPPPRRVGGSSSDTLEEIRRRSKERQKEVAPNFSPRTNYERSHVTQHSYVNQNQASTADNLLDVVIAADLISSMSRPSTTYVQVLAPVQVSTPVEEVSYPVASISDVVSESISYPSADFTDSLTDAVSSLLDD